MTAAQIGKALNADLVLIVDLTDYKLVNVEDSDYYGGSLSGRTFVIDVANSEKLWPADLGSKNINVAFDVERRGRKLHLSVWQQHLLIVQQDISMIVRRINLRLQKTKAPRPGVSGAIDSFYGDLV